MRNKYLFTLIFMITSLFAEAQLHAGNTKDFIQFERLSFTGGFGFSTYYGDLCDNIECMRLRPNLGVGAIYRFDLKAVEFFSLKSEINYFRLYSKDTYENRNNTFRSGNVEIFSSAMFELFPYEEFTIRRLINPYGFLGFGIVYYNPKAELNGEWHALRPLQTEGVKYGSISPIIPFGIGATVKLIPTLSIMAEAGYRITFTDYLDDVSSETFLPQSSFEDPNAGALANPHNRTIQRGNPGRNDGYFMFSVKARFTIPVPNVTNAH
jgi:hypothetical protein